MFAAKRRGRWGASLDWLAAAAARCAWLLVLAWSSCNADGLPSLENRACTSDGKCIAGYTCSARQVCVQIGSQETDHGRSSDGPQRDAEVDDARAAIDSGVGGRASTVAGGRGGSPAPAMRPSGGAGGSASAPKPAAGSGGMPAAPPPAAGAGGSSSTSVAGSSAMPPTGTAGTNPSQPPSTAGGAGAGGCGAGSTTCNGSCSQLAWDPSNCGSCGNACPSPPNGTPGCILGICLTTCEGSRTLCTNECLDTQNDDKNCGGCNAVCGLAQRCVAGSCALLGQTGSGPVNVLGLQLLLSTLNLPVAVLATVLGIDPKDVGAAKISYDDLIEAGITRKQLDEQGITLDELESVGIDVSAERKRRSP